MKFFNDLQKEESEKPKAMSNKIVINKTIDDISI